jgi:hypothetical protein
VFERGGERERGEAPVLLLCWTKKKKEKKKEDRSEEDPNFF